MFDELNSVIKAAIASMNTRLKRAGFVGLVLGLIFGFVPWMSLMVLSVNGLTVEEPAFTVGSWLVFGVLTSLLAALAFTVVALATHLVVSVTKWVMKG